jgi:hypothetical protein
MDFVDIGMLERLFVVPKILGVDRLLVHPPELAAPQRVLGLLVPSFL